MDVGVAQVDITPLPGTQLQGFAVREQPSIAVADSLMVRALYVKSDQVTMLWLVFDLLSLESELLRKIRNIIVENVNIDENCIFLTCTHTHSGPAVNILLECGDYDEKFVEALPEASLHAARQAMESAEKCEMFFTESASSLGHDRHRGTEKFADSRIPVLLWKKTDGSDAWKAVFTSYSMHPVCLKENKISADWPGVVSRTISSSLRGNPVALVTSGACGNIDPPGVGVDYRQMTRWGEEIAENILSAINRNSFPMKTMEQLTCRRQTVGLLAHDTTEDDIRSFVQATLSEGSGIREFGEKYSRVANDWQAYMLDRLRHGVHSLSVELGVMRFDDITFVTVSGEIFAHLSPVIDAHLKHIGISCRPPYIIGNTDGSSGYIGPVSAYENHCYEVHESCLFYRQPRLQKGCLERLGDEAGVLLMHTFDNNT